MGYVFITSQRLSVVMAQRGDLPNGAVGVTQRYRIPLKFESSTCNQLRFCISIADVSSIFLANMGLNSSYLEFPYQKKHWTYRIQGMFVYQTRAKRRKPCQTDSARDFWGAKTVYPRHPSNKKSAFKMEKKQ